MALKEGLKRPVMAKEVVREYDLRPTERFETASCCATRFAKRGLNRGQLRPPRFEEPGDYVGIGAQRAPDDVEIDRRVDEW
jgi:hypothetical protein